MHPSVRLATRVGMKMRHLGARLAAGFLDIALVAQILELDVDTYRSFEQDEYPDIELHSRMARTFGVDLDYFLNGTLTTPREHLAELIAEGLANIENQQVFGPHPAKGWPQTLTRMRQFARFRSPQSAAARLNLNPLAYLAQETGARPISGDALISYCLLFNVRPDLALANKPLARLWGPEYSGWWRRQSVGAFTQTNALVDHAFDWLRDDNCAGPVLNLPIVKFVKSKWQLADQTLQWPRSLLTVSNPIAGDTLYAVAGGHEQGTWLTVVNPTRVGESSVGVDGNGEIHTLHGAPAAAVVDPIYHRPGRKDVPYCVGSWVARITLASR